MLHDINWSIALDNSISMGAAYLLALPIAYNREAKTRSAGLRTFPLVSIASCAFMLIAIEVFLDSGAHARVVQGIITGIGFIGGGAILKSDNNVTGTATATSIWATGAIGIAVAWNRFEIAAILCLATFLTLQLSDSVKEALVDDDQEKESG